MSALWRVGRAGTSVPGEEHDGGPDGFAALLRVVAGVRPVGGERDVGRLVVIPGVNVGDSDYRVLGPVCGAVPERDRVAVGVLAQVRFSLVGDQGVQPVAGRYAGASGVVVLVNVGGGEILGVPRGAEGGQDGVHDLDVGRVDGVGWWGGLALEGTADVGQQAGPARVREVPAVDGVDGPDVVVRLVPGVFRKFRYS